MLPSGDVRPLTSDGDPDVMFGRARRASDDKLSRTGHGHRPQTGPAHCDVTMSGGCDVRMDS